MEVEELVRGIGDDVRTIARKEVELMVDELHRTARATAVELAVAVLAGVVALIGLGMLCAVAVAALAPVIHPLWLRLLIMAVVYLALGGVVAAAEGRRLTRNRPHLAAAAYELKRTARGAKEALSHA